MCLQVEAILVKFAEKEEQWAINFCSIVSKKWHVRYSSK